MDEFIPRDLFFKRHIRNACMHKLSMAAMRVDFSKNKIK